MNIDIDTIIKETKYPLLLLLNIYNNPNIKDKDKLRVTKLYFIHHIELLVEYNILDLNDLNNDPLTKTFIHDVYNIIGRQLIIIQSIKKFKNMYKNIRFWKMNIEEMIEHLYKLNDQLLCIFDGTKSNYFFHLRISNITNKNHNNIDEIVSRLKKAYDLFKYSFFEENNIIIVSYSDFIHLEFKEMVIYVEYIFNKLKKILDEYIYYFTIYNYHRRNLYNILYSDNNINIDIDINVSSDIEEDDINYININ